MADTIIVNDKAQKNIISLVKGILEKRQKFQEIYTKMENIDIAYARYKETSVLPQGLDVSGRDNSRDKDVGCGNVFDSDNIIPPIVVSQVDTMTAYLSDIFLSGTPLFPVVSPPNKVSTGEKLEVLLDDHAQLGGYVRQLSMFLRDGLKYNFSGLEVEWSSIDQFSVESDFQDVAKGRKVDKKLNYLNKLKRLDPYNLLWDTSVNPGDVATEGDYAGYIEIVTKQKMKRFLNRLSNEKKSMNVKEALNLRRDTASTGTVSNNYSGNFRDHPTVSEYVTRTVAKGDTDWSTYFEPNAVGKKKKTNLYDGSSYEKITVYARILPDDMDIKAPSPNTPQIWKFVVVNGEVVVQAERLISAYDLLPILMGQPLEDGLGYQTQSLAEGAIPFQDAASTLFNIRFSAARRAVSDRALYNPDLINPDHANSKVASAKIPVRFKALSTLGFDNAYKQIPFDMRGTETTLSDARVIVGFSQELSGINGPQQGQFQKGNKSVREWEDTIGGSDSRLRLPALILQCQVFTPLKQILALNIFQFGENAKVVSQRTGEVVDIDIDALRKEVLAFKLADGYSPKSTLASTDMLTAGMNMIMNSPILQQQFGQGLGNMFSHMMSLGGVKNLDLYLPQPAQGQVVQPATQSTAPVAPLLNQ